MEMKTKFAGASPFLGVPDAPESILKINRQKPLVNKKTSTYKYDAVFNQLKFGDSVTVALGDEDKVQQAMSDWIKRNKKQGIARRRMNDPVNGQSTVYWVAKKDAK